MNIEPHSKLTVDPDDLATPFVNPWKIPDDHVRSADLDPDRIALLLGNLWAKQSKQNNSTDGQIPSCPNEFHFRPPDC